MAILCPLFSGSSGNATYIGYDGVGIMIDAGVTAKRIEDALSAREWDADGVLGLFITHEHIDHVRGLSVFSRKHAIPVFASEGTGRTLKGAGILEDVTAFSECVAIGGFTISRFDTSHDCEGSSGYIVLTPDGKRIGVCTDLGTVTDGVKAALTGCDAVLIESNHDLAMLRNGSYPAYLKSRIRSDFGHLSNPVSADLVAYLASAGTTRFILGHLSKENNTPALALDCARTRLALCGLEDGRDYFLTAAAPEGNGPVVI